MSWSEREELVELMARYADVSDTNGWQTLSLSVFCDQITCDFSSLGAPVVTVSRESWCRQGERAFAGWSATHHLITGHRIAVEGDRATIRALVRAEHWLAPEEAAGGPGCWLGVGFYDNTAVRTGDGWRLDSVTLTAVHQENPHLRPSAPRG